VILMNDPTRGDARVPEIQFGFPVNYQLLEDNECNETVSTTQPQPPVVEPALPASGPVDRDQWYYRYTPDPQLCQYLSRTWDEVLDKVQTGHAKYYDPASDK